jgi:CAAX protease family protein
LNPITSLIKRYPQATFWLIAWATSFFGWYMVSRDPSGPWLFFLYGPFVGGLLVIAISEGRSGLKAWFSRIVRWRVGIQWYAVALLLPVVLRLAAFGLNILSGARLIPNPELGPLSDHLMGILFPSFLGIALAEEPGFRGYALPKLMEKRSALSASLILGVLHAIWHIPLFIFGSDSPIIIPIIISGAILNTWIFNRTNGSVLMNMLLHTSIDRMVYVFQPMFSPADAGRQTIWLVVVFVVVAILLPILTGKELGRKPAPAMETTVANQPLAAD